MIENFLRHLKRVALCLPEGKKEEGKLVVFRLVLGRVLPGSLLSSSLPILCASVLAFCAVLTHAPSHNWLKSTSNELAVAQALSVWNKLN